MEREPRPRADEALTAEHRRDMMRIPQLPPVLERSDAEACVQRLFGHQPVRSDGQLVYHPMWCVQWHVAQSHAETALVLSLVDAVSAKGYLVSDTRLRDALEHICSGEGVASVPLSAMPHVVVTAARAQESSRALVATQLRRRFKLGRARPLRSEHEPFLIAKPNWWVHARSATREAVILIDALDGQYYVAQSERVPASR